MKTLRWVLLLLLLPAVQSFALEPGWYSPLDRSGQALHVRCNGEDQCVLEWNTYVEGQVFLISEGLCKRDETTCEEALDITEGCFDGLGCDATRIPTGAVIAVEQLENAIRLEWDVRTLRPEACPPDLLAGGLLLRRCINTRGKTFHLLAQ